MRHTRLAAVALSAASLAIALPTSAVAAKGSHHANKGRHCGKHHPVKKACTRGHHHKK